MGKRMINIMNLVIEQRDKIHKTYNGGFKYGRDYNILKAIVEHHKNKSLVRQLVRTFEDKTLMDKVKTWMVGA